MKFNKINSSIIHLSSKKASFQVIILVFRTDMAGLTKKPDSDFGCLALLFLYIIYKVQLIGATVPDPAFESLYEVGTGICRPSLLFRVSDLYLLVVPY